MEKVRLQYIDLLKTASILAIISIHFFAMWQTAEITNLNIYSFVSISRFGVPVFIMITGALLLNREIKISDFLKRKGKRLIYPFIFYYLLSAFVIVVLLNSNSSQITNIFSFRWYFWMILGVYLSIPIINKFIQHSTTNEIRYFIALFVFASIFYQITYYFKVEQYFNLTLFISPLGYLVLGYYLSQKKFNLPTNKLISISLILFIATTCIKIISLMGMIPMVENFFTSAFLSSYLDVGFFEILQASSFFVLCKSIYESTSGPYSKIKEFLSSKIILRFITSVSRASYGMYMINLIPTSIYFYIKNIPLSGTQTILAILSLSFLTFFISWIAVLLINRIPFIKNASGYL